MSYRFTRGSYCLSAPLVLLATAEVLAGHINAPLFNTLRSTLGPDQGYLAFVKTDPPLPLGEEVTGWTDVRHPAYFVGNGGPNINIRDTRLGYDRYDHFVETRSVFVTDSGGATASSANLARDYDFANAAYAQLGMSVIARDHVSATYNNVTTPIDSAERDLIRAANRAAAPTVNMYYVDGFSEAGLRGIAYRPEIAGGNGGFLVQDARVNDTWGHELGHFLIDNHRFADSNGANQGHGAAASDLMCNGDDRTVPPTDQKLNGFNSAPRKVGFLNGPNVGGLSRFNEMLATPPNFPGGPFNVGQPTAVFNTESDGTSYVQVRDRADFAGDRADFNWVVDSWQLEDIAGRADNHPGARENLYFVKGPINQSPHTDHDHGNWGELNYNAFAGDTFKYADVVSQIARYADMDVDGSNNWSPRESALDYVLEFSADGTTWIAGTPISIFEQGWTLASDAENFICRWESPVNATLLRVRAALNGTNGHDGNTQIDAIIVSAFVPEPASSATIVAAAALLLGRRARSRERAAPSDRT